jgi:hypothetical protein
MVENCVSYVSIIVKQSGCCSNATRQLSRQEAAAAAVYCAVDLFVGYQGKRNPTGRPHTILSVEQQYRALWMSLFVMVTIVWYQSQQRKLEPSNPAI